MKRRPPISLPQPALSPWDALQQSIIACNLCPRLRQHCTTIGEVRRAAFREQQYWAKPIPNLGLPSARLLILGLAPAAHGANRTGRMFTGDRSGDFLFEAMHAEGFSTQPTSKHIGDGLELIDCAITATAHCAPPPTNPSPMNSKTAETSSTKQSPRSQRFTKATAASWSSEKSPSTPP